MRKVFIVISCCIALLLAGYAGYRGYTVTKRNRGLGMARSFIAANDTRNALLSLQQVLRADPQNVEATRLLADLSEMSRSPNTLLLRARVVELNPLSVDDRLALAKTAMILRDLATATNTLEGVRLADRNTAAYHNIAGAVAAAVGQSANAESHFQEALKLDPNNQFIQLNLAVVRLHNTNLPTANEARASLARISSTATNSALRCLAIRELASNALRARHMDEALALSKRILQEPDSAFRDRIFRLEVLMQTDKDEFQTALAAFQREAQNEPGKIFELATWRMLNGASRESLIWLQSLPKNIRTNQTVQVLSAECRSMLKDWRGLQTQLQSENWDDLEFTRHALLCRALRGQVMDESAKAEWEAAVQAAGGHRGPLFSLLRLTAQWNWMSETEEILWAIFNRYPEEKAIVPVLTQALVMGGRTRSLMQLNSQVLKRTPGDLGAKNNLALTALLLNAQELKPHVVAKEVYDASPTNAAYASTYAFSLYLQSKTADALKIMEHLKPEAFEDPSIAGYYGLILKASGNAKKALPYLNSASKGSLLLPEEKKLFETARAG